MRAKCAYYWQKMRLTYLSHFITRQRKIIPFSQHSNRKQRGKNTENELESFVFLSLCFSDKESRHFQQALFFNVIQAFI